MDGTRIRAEETASTMRLRPEKVQQLAEFIHDSLKANPGVALAGERRDIAFEIAKVINEDLKTEERIEAQARKVLDEHADAIKGANARYDQMLKRAMQKIARDEGFKL